MLIRIFLTIDFDAELYAERGGFPIEEAQMNLASELALMSDALTWHVVTSEVGTTLAGHSDVIQTILGRERNGSGGGIPLTRGEVAMLFLDGYAGDGPDLLDIRSQGYGDDYDWDGLAVDDVLEDEDTAFVWTKWEPLELWP